MATIEIPDSLFARLQKLAVPLVDTSATVLERLVANYEAQTGQVSAVATQPQRGESQSQRQAFDTRTPPSLRHTRVITADFGGRKADGWNSLVHAAHIEAVRRLGSVEAVRRVTTSQMILGRPTSVHEKKGYRYVAEINAGIQNVDAEHAWSNTLRLAKTLKVPVEVDFEWLPKSEAAYPGKQGRLLWKPKEEAAPTK
jgi:hypothetical protein